MPANLSRRRLLTAAPTVVVPGWLLAGSAQSAADLVLVNGDIHTVDAGNKRVEALAILGNRIIAAGGTKQIESLIGPSTHRVDLQGRTVLPGINDSHLHLLGWGMSQPPFAIDVTYPVVESIADVVRAVQQAVANAAPGEWIVGRGWDQPYLSEGRPPAAADLDAVSPVNPVALTEFSGHAMWANSRALELAGIGADTQPPPGGVIVRDDTGNATGLLFEGAAWMVSSAIPEATPERRTAAIRNAMRRMLERGITSATEPGLNAVDLRIYNQLAREGASREGGNLRMTGLIQAGVSAATLRTAIGELREISSADVAWLRLPGVKIMGDGIPTGNKTAWLHEPYVGGGNGSLLVGSGSHAERVAELNAMIALIHDAGLQAGTHVTGDASIDAAVGACVAAQRSSARTDPRHYVIHADLVSPATLAQMAASGIGANFNPEIKHLIADAQVRSIGPERAAYEWPYHTALAAGVSVASSSDAPVTPGNWLQGLATMVERKGKQSGMVSGPEERISLDAAIRTYTWAGAWQDHAEHVKGSLEPGKLADLCVLDERISATPPERWAGTSVFMTIVDGRVAYQAGVA